MLLAAILLDLVCKTSRKIYCGLGCKTQFRLERPFKTGPSASFASRLATLAGQLNDLMAMVPDDTTKPQPARTESTRITLVLWYALCPGSNV
jgi:hypothetical protein